MLRFVALCCTALHRGEQTEKNQKSDAKRCILMHGRLATFESERILRVGLVEGCIIGASNNYACGAG
jgi:hypothetical protein